ncbi:MAG: Smr/MutS family protein [Thermoguttaceae bacterium]|nr:Smr/MutS family protein [Thermoguttaceae bacterium]
MAKIRYDIMVDLHGLRGSEAEQKIRNLLTATANRRKSVLIVHGVGQGILRERIRHLLQDLPQVLEFRPGEDYLLPGLSGVTAVWLR